jgi:hypothetical protein
MAGQRVRCKTCRKQFTRIKGSRRIYCETCRPPRTSSAPITELHPPTEPGPAPIGVLGAVKAQLDKREASDTAEAAIALHLATQLDAGGHTGSQTAALTRELRAALAEALKHASRVGDRLDELSERRASRFGA